MNNRTYSITCSNIDLRTTHACLVMKDMCSYRPVTSIFVQITWLETFKQFAPPKPIISIDFCRNAAKYCEDVRSVGIKSEKDQGRRRVGGWWMGQQTQDVHPGVLVSRMEPQVNADLFYRRWSYWMRQNTIISTFNPMVWFSLVCLNFSRPLRLWLPPWMTTNITFIHRDKHKIKCSCPSWFIALSQNH